MYITVLQYLEKTASKFPEKVAFADIKESFTFRDLELLAKRIGTAIAKDIGSHNPVIVYMDKRAYNIIAFMGVAYAGCYYVPIDSQMPIERINLILDILNPSMILYDDITASAAKSFDIKIKKHCYKTMLKTGIDEKVLLRIRSYSMNTDLLYILFTSGSTGIPKGVTISHSAVIDFVDWICDAYNLDDTTTMCNQAPFYFDASIPDIYIPLKVASTVYIPPRSYYTFPKKILQYIENNKINTLVWVPSALCNVVNCKAFEVCAPQSVRLVIFCGEVMPCKYLNVWKKYIPDALYVNMYGPTEATYACMYYNIERQFDDNEKLPLGKACENSKILLLENNQIAVNGQIGEICILGQCLSQGYYNDPERTTAVFLQNPTNTKWLELMYRTGDLAYMNEFGDIVFAGRKDFQIKRLGHRIELSEIENIMLSINEIENACCVFNENNSDIIAVYAGKIKSDALRVIVSEKLPHYMIPNRFVCIKALPMNLNGKIDRTLLKKQYVEVKYGETDGNS